MSKITEKLINFFEIDKFNNLSLGKQLLIGGLAAIPALTVVGIIASPFVFKGAVHFFSRNVKVQTFSPVSPVANSIFDNAQNTIQFALLPEVLTTKEHSHIHQFQVLDQKKAKMGDESCGYHAWKNALLGLSLSTFPSAKTATLLKDAGFFNDAVVPFISKSDSANDVTIVDLEQAMRNLETNPTDQLQPLADALAENQQRVSIMVTEGDVFSYDETTIHNLVNLFKTYESDGPWTHAIIIGSQGHWTTLFLQKTEDNQLVWSGCDSWHNQKNVLTHHKMLIENALNNREETLQNAFQYAVGDMLERKRHWFHEDGSLKDSSDLHLLIDNPEYADRFTRRLEAGYDFLVRLDLLDDDFYQDSISTLKIAAKFYADHLEDTHKQKAKMQAIHQDLETYE